MKNLKTISCVLFLSCLCAAGSALATVQEDFAKTLELVRQKFQDRYALEPWKSRVFHWTIDGAASRILEEGNRDPNLTADGARDLIQDFFHSARDYHAEAIYSPGGYTSIPIDVRSVHHRVFVTRVADDCNCDIVPGDELLTFDGVRAMRAIIERMTLKYPNHVLSDVRDGNRRLTVPYGMLMEPMPTKASADLVLRGADGKKKTVSLAWKKPKPALNVLSAPAHPMIPASLRGWSRALVGTGPYGSVFPKPVKTIWESAPRAMFPAWIAELPGRPGKKIGWLRIPTFSPGQPADYTAGVKEFEAAVARMNQDADVLLLDELGNPGGMADYLYALGSYFFDHDVPTFKFSYRLFDGLVKDATTTLPDLEKIHSDADAKAFFGGEDYFGYPVDLAFATEVKAFYAGLVDDAKAGLKFGKFRFYNAARVRPNPRVRYLKPVFVLADERSVSCGDFFAAFMQDTKRAEVIGGWTMGAGAFTGGAETIDSPLKTNLLIVPLAMGIRLDGRTPIENLGVLPTHWVSPTVADYQNGYREYGADVFRYIAKKIRK